MTVAAYIKHFCITWAVVTLMTGCNFKTEPPEAPKVVKKKIVSTPKPAAKPQPTASAEKKKPGASENPQEAKTEQKPKTQKPKVVISDTAKKKLAAKDLPLYDPKGKIDPFAPLIKAKREKQPLKEKVKKRIPRTPLEKMDYSQMKLVAIVKTPKGDKALVEETSGKGYIISKGTYIGLNSGRVIGIEKDRIIIEEKVENVLGAVETVKRELMLQKPPGEF